jgi:methylglutaconyl-CoA hydratase
MTEIKYKTIVATKKGSEEVLWITLNRPKVHNAFNSEAILELIDAFDRIKIDDSVRVVVLTGEGKSFCAGADINWMRDIKQYSFDQNLEESLQLADVLYKIYTLPKPTIAMVNGAAIGGGAGFLSVCDIAVAAEEAKFSLSELKIGLVPAVISPYVIRKIGESKAREYFLTGHRISAQKAVEIGLINEVVPGDKLEERIEELIAQFLASGPKAIASCKELILNVSSMSLEDVKEYTARMIANLRISEEGQEGMSAFLEKRKPRWIHPKEKEKE